MPLTSKLLSNFMCGIVFAVDESEALILSSEGLCERVITCKCLACVIILLCLKDRGVFSHGAEKLSCASKTEWNHFGIGMQLQLVDF